MEFELSFEMQNPTIRQHWDTLNQRFKIFSKLHSLDPGVNSQSSTSLLLHLGGDAVLELISTSLILKKEGDSTARDLLANIESLCLPKFILLYERYKLFVCHQQSGECVCQFLSQLARLVELCGIEGDVEACIKDRIIHGITDVCLREQLLLIQDRDLSTFVEICQGYTTCETGKCCECFGHFVDTIHNLKNIETIVPDRKYELEEINSLLNSSSKNVAKCRTFTDKSSSEILLDDILMLKKEEYNLDGPVHKTSESSNQPAVNDDSLLTESVHDGIHPRISHPIENMLPLNEREATKFLTENVIVTVPGLIQPQFKMETLEDGMPSLVPPPREDSPIPIFVSFDDSPARNKQNGFFELYDKWLDKPCGDSFGDLQAGTQNTEISDVNSSKTDDVTGSETNDPSTETSDPTGSETDDEDCVFIPVSPSPTVIVSDDEDDEASENKHQENNQSLRADSSIDLCGLKRVSSVGNTFFDKYETFADTLKDNSSNLVPVNYCSSLSVLHDLLANKMNHTDVSSREEEEKHETNESCSGKTNTSQNRVMNDKEFNHQHVSSVSKHSPDPKTGISSEACYSVPNTLLHSCSPYDGKPQYNRTPQRQCITTLRKRLIKTGLSVDNVHPLDDTSNNTEKSVSTLSLINIFKTDVVHSNGAHYNGAEYPVSYNNSVSCGATESRKRNVASVVLLKNKRNISEKKALISNQGSLPPYFSKRTKEHPTSTSSTKSNKISQAFLSDAHLSSDKTTSNFWDWAETVKQLTHPGTESSLVCSTTDTRNSPDTSSVSNRDLTHKRSLIIEEEEINLQSKRQNGGKISVLSIGPDT